MHVSTSPKRGARVLKYLGAALAILSSAWLLVGYEGLKTTAADQSRGWHIYGLPSHPTLHMAVYLVLGLVLPFFSAWLTRPAETCIDAGKPRTFATWQRYLFRVGLSLALAFVTAFFLVFLLMALLDAGVV